MTLTDQAKELLEDLGVEQSDFSLGVAEIHLRDAIDAALREEREKLRAAVEALEEFVLSHEHAPDLEHTRAMGDTYGWCDYCHTKVTWGSDPAREAIEKIRGGG